MFTTPMGQAVKVQRAAFKVAQKQFKGTTQTARAAWRAGTTSQPEYRRQFRTASHVQNAALKAARATGRDSRIAAIKSART